MFFRRTAQPRRPTPAPAEPRRPTNALRKQADAVAANRLLIHSVARVQFGLATWTQLGRRGMADSAIARAVASERLVEVHPGVYSIVPLGLMTVDGWHAAAILAGGDGACLCSHSAGWWADVLASRPAQIHVAVKGAMKEVEGVRWHRLNLGADDRTLHRRMPITVFERIALDLAADLTHSELKGVLAELEYHHGVDPDAVRLTLRRGYRGAANLRRALDEHTPQLALTRRGLERAFATFLIERNFTLPDFNHPVGKSTVDAVYDKQRIVIELDGVAGHRGERRILRDHRRDLHRRADGFLPVRYHFTQITNPADQELVEAELDRLGIPRNRVAGLPVSNEPRRAASVKR